MSDPDNSRGPGNKNITFNQAVDWAKKNINANREKHTWDSKFWYVICGIIVLIIILGFVYIFYWRRKSRSVGTNESILETINQNVNNIPPVSLLTPRPSSDRSPILPPYNQPPVYNNNPVSNFNSFSG